MPGIRDRTKNGGQGMNWIRQTKRLALYLRDGLACVYCGQGIEEGATLTLDHLTPHSLGGSNAADNLVTACRRCNAARGTRDYHDFAVQVAAYLNHGIEGAVIVAHIEATVRRPVDIGAAKSLIAARGNLAHALHPTRGTVE